jgi:hypothetical protein
MHKERRRAGCSLYSHGHVCVDTSTAQIQYTIEDYSIYIYIIPLFI